MCPDLQFWYVHCMKICVMSTTLTDQGDITQCEEVPRHEESLCCLMLKSSAGALFGNKGIAAEHADWLADRVASPDPHITDDYMDGVLQLYKSDFCSPLLWSRCCSVSQLYSWQFTCVKINCKHLISDLTPDEQQLLHSIQEKKKQLLFEIQVSSQS